MNKSTNYTILENKELYKLCERFYLLGKEDGKRKEFEELFKKVI